MGFFKKMFGICETRMPVNPKSWRVSGEKIVIDLTLTDELKNIGDAIRLEGNGLSKRVFVLKGEGDGFFAYENKCAHMGRRLDPGDSSGVVKCCSLSGSVFDLSGKPVGGAAKHPLKTFSIQKKGNCLEIDIASH